MIKTVLSIIVPVYNSASTISECLKPILDISDISTEIVLIDDGSTDQSAELCDYYKSVYSNVIVIHQKNEGVSSARNKGIEVSSGEYVYFIDSDDVPCVDALLNSISIMESSCADVLLGSYSVTDMDKLVINDYINEQVGLCNPEDSCISFLNNKVKACIGAFLVRQSCISDIRFLNGIRYGEDTTFIAECMANAKTIWIESSIHVLYRQNNSSVMHKLDLSRFDNYFARKALKEYVASEHSEMGSLLETISNQYIPQVIEDDIRLLCHYGFPYKKLKNYLTVKCIESEIKALFNSNDTAPSLYSELYHWNTKPFAYYVSERSKRLKYIIRSKLGMMKRRVISNRE